MMYCNLKRFPTPALTGSGVEGHIVLTIILSNRSPSSVIISNFLSKVNVEQMFGIW